MILDTGAWIGAYIYRVTGNLCLGMGDNLGVGSGTGILFRHGWAENTRDVKAETLGIVITEHA